MIAAIALANTAKAQETVPTKTDYREHTMWGVKAGTNYSNVYDSQGESFDADGKFGFAAGAFISIPIGKYLGIQPEVLYSQKGFRATGQLLGSSYKFTRTTSYIDVPLYIAFKPSEFVTILAGPQYSYLLTQKDVFTNALASTEQETEFKNDNIRRNTLCVAGGFDLNLKHIVVGGRAGWDLQNNNGDGSSTTPRYKNTWIQGTVGFRL
jgi:hypothetical protein